MADSFESEGSRLFRRGQMEQEAGRHEEAHQYFRGAFDAYVADGRLGDAEWIATTTGRPEDAVQMYADREMFYEAGKVEEGEGRYAEARSFYERAIDMAQFAGQDHSRARAGIRELNAREKQ